MAGQSFVNLVIALLMLKSTAANVVDTMTGKSVEEVILVQSAVYFSIHRTIWRKKSPYFFLFDIK